MKPQENGPTIADSLPTILCNPKNSPRLSLGVKIIIYGLSAAHRPAVKRPTNIPNAHHNSCGRLSKGIKEPINSMNTHPVNTICSDHLGPMMSTIRPQIKALGIATIIPVRRINIR